MNCVFDLIIVSPLLTEKLSGRKLNVAEVTQSEIGQKQKLQTVLEAVNELLRPHGWSIEWSVDCEFYIDFTVLVYTRATPGI